MAAPMQKLLFSRKDKPQKEQQNEAITTVAFVSTLHMLLDR